MEKDRYSNNSNYVVVNKIIYSVHGVRLFRRYKRTLGRRLLSIKLDLNLGKKLTKCYIWGVAFVWCWNWNASESRSEIAGKFWKVLLEKDGEKIVWSDLVGNEVLHAVCKERNVLQAIKRSKADWIGHILRRNCLLRHVTEGKIEWSTAMTGRR